MLGFEVTGLIDAMGFFYYILVYGVGLIAMALSVSAFQLRYRVAIILFNFFGQSAWVAYFLLQGDVTSAIACALSAVMLAVFTKKGTWKWVGSPLTTLLFILVLSGFSLLSFQGWSDVFPLLAGVFAVIANSQISEKRLRWFSVLWCLFWLLNATEIRRRRRSRLRQGSRPLHKQKGCLGEPPRQPFYQFGTLDRGAPRVL